MRLVLGTLLVPLLLSCGPDMSQPKGGAGAGADDACTVAVRFAETWLREWTGRPLVFSDAADSTSAIPTEGTWWKLASRTGEEGEAPSPTLLKAAGALNRDSAVSRCPQLRAHLDRAHIPHGANAVEAVTGTSKIDQSYRAAIFGLTLPNVSPDGSEALVMTSIVHAPLSGGGMLLLLKREPDGTWRAVSGQQLWIS